MTWGDVPGVMSGEEFYDLEHRMLFDRSHELEFKVRDAAKDAAERSLHGATQQIVVFAEPVRAGFYDTGRLPVSIPMVRVVVDVRCAHDLKTAALLAEEQIRRQLRDHTWARLPDLSGPAE